MSGSLSKAEVLEQTPPPQQTAQYSSSLLRICKYSYSADTDTSILNDRNPEDTGSATTAAASKHHVAFGAHTDSSFLTLALCSSTPGLELVDQASNKWVCPESLEVGDRELSGIAQTESAGVRDGVTGEGGAPRQSKPSRRVIVFVGEFLQVLTKNRYKAAVHRVVQYSSACDESSNRGPPSNSDRLSTVFDSKCSIAPSSCGEIASTPQMKPNQHIQRSSCPYLIRGQNSAVISITDPKYIHPGGEAAITPDKIPDLDGTTMRLLHKLLDLKRQKCFRENDSKPGNWVLSAFPIENMPVEDN